jgi:phosphoribosylamine-glycine ligase
MEKSRSQRRSAKGVTDNFRRRKITFMEKADELKQAKCENSKNFTRKFLVRAFSLRHGPFPATPTNITSTAAYAAVLAIMSFGSAVSMKAANATATTIMKQEEVSSRVSFVG